MGLICPEGTKGASGETGGMGSAEGMVWVDSSESVMKKWVYKSNCNASGLFASESEVSVKEWID